MIPSSRLRMEATTDFGVASPRSHCPFIANHTRLIVPHNATQSQHNCKLALYTALYQPSKVTILDRSGITRELMANCNAFHPKSDQQQRGETPSSNSVSAGKLQCACSITELQFRNIREQVKTSNCETLRCWDEASEERNA
ncbi:hypothetical protein M758_UG111600 [Ceratodon purpureus]|nr:hypothetical protein M758_UG111600 [Ceratodon purpureus]